MKSMEGHSLKSSLGDDDLSEKRSNDDPGLSSMSESYFQLLDPLNIGLVFEDLTALLI